MTKFRVSAKIFINEANVITSAARFPSKDYPKYLINIIVSISSGPTPKPEEGNY